MAALGLDKPHDLVLRSRCPLEWTEGTGHKQQPGLATSLRCGPRVICSSFTSPARLSGVLGRRAGA